MGFTRRFHQSRLVLPLDSHHSDSNPCILIVLTVEEMPSLFSLLLLAYSAKVCSGASEVPGKLQPVPGAPRQLQSGTLAFTAQFATPGSVLYTNTSYTVTWASSGSTVQGGSVRLQLFTSPGNSLAATLLGSVSALAGQATFLTPVSPSYGAYSLVLTSLADASIDLMRSQPRPMRA